MSRLYLYGFVPAGAPLPDAGLAGVADGVVELVEDGGVAAVVSPAPESEFGDAALEARSSDLDWMAAQGLRHEQVVAWFVDHATILPSRLLTLFTGADAVRSIMKRDARRIRAALERLEGVREWDLKLGHDPAAMEAHLPEVSDAIAALDREIPTASPGKQFLLRKKRQELARGEVRAAARRLARELVEELEPHAVESRRLDPPADDAPVLLNAAFLVARDSEQALVEAAGRAAGRLEPLGLTVRLTGPWAAYRFLSPEPGAGDE